MQSDWSLYIRFAKGRIQGKKLRKRDKKQLAQEHEISTSNLRLGQETEIVASNLESSRYTDERTKTPCPPVNRTAPHSITFRNKTRLLFLPSPFTAAPALGAQQALKHLHTSEFTHRQAGLFGFFCPEPRKEQGDADSRGPPSPAPASPPAAASPPRTPRAARPPQVPAEPRRAPASSGRPGLQEEEKAGWCKAAERPPAVRGEKRGRRKARLQGNKVFKRRGQRSERRAAPPRQQRLREKGGTGNGRP